MIKIIKLIYSVYRYTNSFNFSNLTRDEKLRIGWYDEALEKKIFDILMEDLSNDIIDWKVNSEFARWFKSWLASRMGVTRKYKSMK